MKALTYLIYIIFWEAAIWYAAYHVVFELHRSNWWLLVALIIGSCAYRPGEWIHGIVEKEEEEEV